MAITIDVTKNKDAAFCSQKSEYTNKSSPLKIKYFDDCDCKAAYKVSYKKGTTGKMIEDVLMCKRHFNALVKNAERVMRINNWDAKITYVKL